MTPSSPRLSYANRNSTRNTIASPSYASGLTVAPDRPPQTYVASLIIAYSHCIAHGIEMRNGLDQQYRAVASGHWPLIRYDPLVRAAGANPFLLDSPRPRIALGEYIYRELRYSMLAHSDPAEADRLLALAQQAVDQRWAVYEEMATYGPERFAPDAGRSRPEPAKGT